MPDRPYLTWPVFRRSGVAAFARSVTVEVKGISGIPTDDDALQASKYVIPRMKEFNRTDIQALGIINHQRNRPPLQRENVDLFRRDILDNAEEQEFGLLTTWDLFRLARSQTRNNWPASVVLPVLYRIGRIDPVPEHYEQIGLIEKWFDAISVIGFTTAATFGVGSRIGIEFPNDFVEAQAASVEVERVAMMEAPAGAPVAVKVALADAPIGARVFLVRDV